MHTESSKTNGRLHRGSFADGETSPDLYPDQRHIGTFAGNQSDPETYSGEDHEGTFAEGQARPDEYARHDHEGTFAEGAANAVSQTPSIDYKCTRCGARHIYQLVPLEQRPTEHEVEAIPHETPSIDLRCSRCGASQTYKLVPDSVLRTPGNRHRQDGNAIRVKTAAALQDLTQGREIGARRYADPTQGREIGHDPYSDPTRAR